MPWISDDAVKHTHLADTKDRRHLWMVVANSQLTQHGDEARAIREANAAVAKSHEKKGEELGREES